VTDLRRSIEEVSSFIRGSKRIAVLTGAGISTESGIPDFRGPNGVWTRKPETMRLVNIGSYLRDPQIRVEAWQERMRHPAWTAEPNAGHRALVQLERQGTLLALMTQNIDGLHRAAGSERVLELHGTIHEAKCLTCDRRTPMQEQLDRVRAGEPDPACSECGGIQKSATVAFGEQLDALVLETAVVASSGCDLFLAIGTSLSVQPAAQLAAEAHRRGARLVIVNQGETQLDDRADVVLRDRIGEVLPRLVVASLTQRTRSEGSSNP
jgi:NAD-dependent deacetylase